MKRPHQGIPPQTYYIHEPSARQSKIVQQHGRNELVESATPANTTAEGALQVQVITLSPHAAVAGLTQLWQHGQLCDVQLYAKDGAIIMAHGVCLAAASGFFRALLCGAGACMREASISGSSSGGGSRGGSSSQGTAAADPIAPACPRASVHLPDVEASDLRAVLEAVYGQPMMVGPDNLERLLAVASYLDMPSVIEACCMFMRSSLGLHTCAPLHTLACRYSCDQMRAELLLYLCSHFPSLAALASQPLAALPKDLLMELLTSDDLAVDCEADVMQVICQWVAADSPARMSDMRDLIAAAVRLDQLPANCQLSPPSGASEAHAQALQHAQALVAQAQAQLTGGALAPPGAAAGCSHSRAAAHGGGAAAAAGTTGSARSSSSSCCTRVSDLDTGSYAHREGTSRAYADQPRGAHAAVAAAADARATYGRDHVSAPMASPWSTSTSAMGLHGRGRPRRHQSTGLIAAGGHDASWLSLSLVELYDPVTDTWTAGPSMRQSMPFAACTQLDRTVYAVGATPHRSCVSRLSLHPSMPSASEPQLPGRTGYWESCPSLGAPHAQPGVVAAAGQLFVLGGRQQAQQQQVQACVEVFDPSRESWSRGPDMCEPRSALAACCSGDQLYAIGGQSTRTTLRSVELLDLGSGQWTRLSNDMRMERKYTAAGVLGGRLYVVGGVRESRTRLASVEAMDPREGIWREVAPMSTARSSCGVAVLHGRLYAVGGSAGDEGVHDSVEVYVPESNSWMVCSPLGCGRSGLGVCPL